MKGRSCSFPFSFWCVFVFLCWPVIWEVLKFNNLSSSNATFASQILPTVQVPDLKVVVAVAISICLLLNCSSAWANVLGVYQLWITCFHSTSGNSSWISCVSSKRLLLTPLFISVGLFQSNMFSYHQCLSFIHFISVFTFCKIGNNCVQFLNISILRNRIVVIL